ncbi:hypothetical protein FE810_14225 [Thalassotalea litorea]|uniref:Uncharacterized protein n=1 Tax=Thalassotalea litorea TaxID=2020715 RepID=A0A5R9IK18_9GAMM|nr:hypothetical protein [Thalassotalea litorea]TLU61662.1 hypothetical protein FE810_14225 [Thalassotalea litorea]
MSGTMVLGVYPDVYRQQMATYRITIASLLHSIEKTVRMAIREFCNRANTAIYIQPSLIIVRGNSSE